MAISLRRRLIVILMGLILAIWLISVVVTAMIAQQMTARQMERQLTHYMDMSEHTLTNILGDRAIADYFQRRSRPVGSDPHVTRMEGFGSQGNEQATNLWFGKSQILIGKNAPQFPPPESEGMITTRLKQGGDGSLWRILYRYSPEFGVWQAAGIDMERVQNLGDVTFWRVILPLLIILPVTAGILFWGVGRGLRPLNQLAEKIATRNPHALDPIDTTDVPAEMKPVVASLNGLLDRLERALASEQRFTSNAAHELQTPLAAIKAEVQRSQRQTSDEDTRIMLERIAARVSRGIETVSQLLTLARLDPDQEFEREAIDLNDLLIEVMAEVGALASDRQIEISVDLKDDPPVRVRGNSDWLQIMIRNLLVNAIQHSIAPGEVAVSLEQLGDRARLVITNDCEPIGEGEFNRLLERFYRPPGGNGQGVGLGLSIAQRIAQLHGAELHLRSRRDTKGFEAEVRFDTL